MTTIVIVMMLMLAALLTPIAFVSGMVAMKIARPAA